VSWIVELEPGVWIAPISGDPGRTLVVEHATVFSSRKLAGRALDDARSYRPFKGGGLRCVDESEQVKGLRAQLKLERLGHALKQDQLERARKVFADAMAPGAGLGDDWIDDLAKALGIEQ
jgi:hypothetical protein